MKWHLIIGLCILATCMSCNLFKKDLALSSDNNRARQTILQEVPIGSSIDYASKVMHMYGIECSRTESDSFREYRNIDFLYCSKQAIQFPLVCDSVWQIAIVHTNGIVSDVLVSYGTACL
jgi:hypothetical protein